MENRGCVGCHGWSTAAQLVNKPGDIYPAMILVTPFDLSASHVYLKITGTSPVGSRMPQGQNPLPTAEIDKFRDWILEGARDN
jgi:hypothetical protein